MYKFYCIWLTNMYTVFVKGIFLNTGKFSPTKDTASKVYNCRKMRSGLKKFQIYEYYYISST
jgi:hypothetical protein